MQIIPIIFKILGFLVDLFKEKNKAKSKKKAELGKELIDALSQTSKTKRASDLNSIVGKLHK